MDALAAEQVSVRFGGVAALRAVDLSVGGGEIVGLVGPNGAGKSTLLGSIGGTVRPQVGSVRLEGREITHLAPHRRAALGVGRTFQHPSLFDSLTVRENLTVGMEGRGLLRRRRARMHDERATELLAAMGLEEYRDAPARDLPYGVKKSVDVVRALMRGPTLLLLDEPGAGLNAAEKERLATLLRELHEREGFGAIVVEHDVDFVMALSSRVYALDFGEVIAHGPPEQVRRDPKVIEAFLGAS